MIWEIQEFVGYCLWPANNYDKVLFLFGPGQDGKSTFLKVLRGLVGAENCTHVDLVDMEDQFLRSMLYNKALCTSAEIDTRMLGSKFLKKISTGDEINAAYKHQQAFDFTPRCKLAFAGNAFPRTFDNSFGLFRRVLPVRFRRQFLGPDRDPFMEEKLLAELPGIFHWALVGLYYLRRRGEFQLSPTTRELLMEYRYENNPVLQWAEERANLAPEVVLNKKPIYENYLVWAKANGFAKPKSSNAFFRALKESLPEINLQYR